MITNLVSELKEYLASLSVKGREGEISNQIDEILYRHEAEQGEEGLRELVKDVYEDIMLNEDTEYDDAESVAVKLGEILISTPAKAVELLHKHPKVKRIGLDILIDDKWVGFTEATVDAAVKSAREYLNSLEDKNNGK